MLNDPAIHEAYRALIDPVSPLKWLLLSYDKSSGGLKLVGTGLQGLQELKATLANNSDAVSFMMFDESIAGYPCLVLISYIPESVSSLRRARALITSRNLRFVLKGYHLVMTIHGLEELTHEAIATAASKTSKPSPRNINVISRSSSEFMRVQKALPEPSETMRRARSEDIFDNNDLPYALAGSGVLNMASGSLFLQNRNSRDKALPIPPSQQSTFHPPSRPILMPDPVARARLREEARLKQEREDERLLRDEQLRQARLQLEKEALMRQHEHDEERRKSILQQDLRRHAALRAQREEEERVREQARARDTEQRKKAARDKRIEQAKRSEEMRQYEQMKRAQEMEQEQSTRRKLEAEKELLRRRGQEWYRTRNGGPRILKGYATIQMSDSLTWRRRWFELTDNQLNLFRSEEENRHPLETIDIQSRVVGVKEWWEGFEELKVVPHSFAIVFRGGDREYMSVFMDQGSDKEALMGLLLALT